MHNFTHTCRPSLNATRLAHFLGMPAEGGRLQPLPYLDLFHEPRQKVLARHRETAVLRRGTVCCVQGLLYQRDPPQATQTTVMYVCSALKTFYTLMRMPNGKPELCGPWRGLSKVLVDGAVQYRPTCGRTLILDQESRTRVLGWRA